MVQPDPNQATFDAIAAWLRKQYEDDRPKYMPGSDEWNDLTAKLAIVSDYEAARGEGRSALGLALRRLSVPLAKRPGWRSAWRPER